MNVVLPPQKTVYVTVFSNSDQSKQNFRHDFEAKKIYKRLNTAPGANPNENYCILEIAIIESMNNHLKEKAAKFNKKRHKRDPWMSYGILKSVNHKNKLYKELKKFDRDSTQFINKKQEFNVNKYVLRRLFNQSKNIYYYAQQFENNKGDGRKTWRTMDNLLHRKASKSKPDAIIFEDKLSTDKGKIADASNKYFATVCVTNENVNQNLPLYEEYLNNPTDASFNFEHVENAAVLQFINKLKPSHSCGCDKISSNILTIIAKEVSPCITLIINQTLSSGIFPS